MPQKNTLEEIYALFDQIEPDEYGCINFLGTKGKILLRHRSNGVRIEGKRFIAARIALERKLGRSIKPGLCALHHCDWPPCINPEHLYEGTRLNNEQDKKDRFPEYKEMIQKRNAASANTRRSSNH